MTEKKRKYECQTPQILSQYVRWACILKKSQCRLYILSNVQTNMDYICGIWNEQNKIYINHFKHDHNFSKSKNNTKTFFPSEMFYPFDKGIIRCC